MTNVVLQQQQQPQQERYCVSFNKSLCAGGASCIWLDTKGGEEPLISLNCGSSLSGERRAALYNAAVGRRREPSPPVGFHLRPPTGPLRPSLCVWVHLQ